MDGNTKAIAEVLRRWHDSAPNVIPFPTPAQRLQRQSRAWMRAYTRPMPPTTPPSAA